MCQKEGCKSDKFFFQVLKKMFSCSRLIWDAFWRLENISCLEKWEFSHPQNGGVETGSMYVQYIQAI